MSTVPREVNLDVFRRYAGLSLPRHVSYPMPTWWENMGPTDRAAFFAEADDLSRNTDLSLYFHIPFCEKLCKFCACTRVILRKTAKDADERVGGFLDAIKAEIRRMAGMVNQDRVVRQIHWGGGSPAYLDQEQVAEIHGLVREHFTLADDAEVAMEVDPRNMTRDRLGAMHELGFNRISLGVQDFNHEVQDHVRRIQPFEMVQATIDACREYQYHSVNFDLIYGLPYQTVETVRDTVEKTIQLGPDRIAYYHYAQIPEKIATQRGMDYTRLPDSETKLEMFLNGIEQFQAAGYDFIGLDHLAKPEEGLSAAMRDGTIQRNFQGMTTGGGLDLVAMGPSAISHLSGIGFLQNERDIPTYNEMIANRSCATVKGKRFTKDDLLRQAVLSDLYCMARVVPERFEKRFDIVWTNYFAREIGILEQLQRDGLVALHDDGSFDVTYPLGRVLMRNIGSVFDAYLEEHAWRDGVQSYFSANA